MRRWLLFFFVSICLVVGCIGCSSDGTENDEQLLYVLSEVAPIQKVYKSEGDRTILYDEFKVEWNPSGCAIRYKSYTEEKLVTLQIGQTKEIELFAVPTNLKYQFFLTTGEGEIPDAWKEMIQENERKQQAKSRFDSLEKYAESRDQETELAIIEDAFHAANLNQDAEIWYRLFLNETWEHGDVSIAITGAKAEKRTTEDSVNLILTDSDGNEMVFFGFANDYIDMVVYKGEIYAGPYTG